MQKIVLQSLGPAIDQKVLAALENWRFTPASKNGVPIPSKQDVLSFPALKFAWFLASRERERNRHEWF